MNADETIALDESLSAQVKALRAGSTARLRLFRRWELVCDRCGERLAEVLATSPVPVLLTRLLAQQSGEATGESDRAAELAQARQRREGPRSGTTVRLPALPTAQNQAGGREQWTGAVNVVCHCQKGTLDAAAIYDDLRRGVRKQTRRPRTLS